MQVTKEKRSNNLKVFRVSVFPQISTIQTQEAIKASGFKASLLKPSESKGHHNVAPTRAKSFLLYESAHPPVQLRGEGAELQIAPLQQRGQYLGHSTPKKAETVPPMSPLGHPSTLCKWQSRQEILKPCLNIHVSSECKFYRNPRHTGTPVAQRHTVLKKP